MIDGANTDSFDELSDSDLVQIIDSSSNINSNQPPQSQQQRNQSRKPDLAVDINSDSDLEVTEVSNNIHNNNTRENSQPIRMTGHRRRQQTIRKRNAVSDSETEANEAIEYFSLSEDEEDIEGENDIHDGPADYGQGRSQGSGIRNFTCPICMDPPSVLAVMNCGHMYCSDCVFKALAASKTCSICRKTINYKTVKFLELCLAPKLNSSEPNMRNEESLVTSV